MGTAPRRASAPLGPRQIAEAAALADVAAALVLISQLFPLLVGVALAACVPFGVVGLRHRFRTCVIALGVGVSMAFLLGGSAPVVLTVETGLVGLLLGASIRRGWSTGKLVLLSLPLLALPSSVLALVLLVAFPGFRDLLFRITGATVTGMANIISGIGLDAVGAAMTTGWESALRWWWLSIPIVLVVAVLAVVWFARVAFGALLIRAQAVLPHQTGQLSDLVSDPGPGNADADDAVVAPVPVDLRDVRVDYGDQRALDVPSLTINPGEFVAVTGRNGTGKSTLSRVLAGAAVSAGSVRRPGSPGLGEPGGTAVVFQRPESQVLGVRVRDDIAFGRELPSGTNTDGLLDRVGLGGMGSVETATLSGGQLQRLAVAAALARNPALLISDESTAMLDGQGREAVLALMSEVADSGTTVVHVTHHDNEARAAGREVRLGPPRVQPNPPLPHRRGYADLAPARGTVHLQDVTVIRDPGTPWDRPVLHNLNLTIPGGSALAITGDNGSGKSTLAWVLAGLIEPTSGTVTVDGQPVVNGRGRVVIGVQNSRLQVLRETVEDDIADASGADPMTVRRVLDLVGLDSPTFARRYADSLSGGEQRRAVLAGLLAYPPQVLVLDEPLAGLDDEATQKMVAALRSIKAAGTTLVYVTHDLTPLAPITDAVFNVIGSREAAQPTRRRGGRPAIGDVVGRPLPETPGRPQVARSAWVGTKLAVLVAMGAAMGIRPDWFNIGASALVLVLWFLLAGAPWRAVPRLPRFFLVFAAISVAIAAQSTGATSANLFGMEVSLSGVDAVLRGLIAVLVSIFAALLFCWTTPLGDIPGFLQTLLTRFGRFGRIGLAFASSLALAIRLGPLAFTEVRTMWVLERQRRPLRRNGKPRGMTAEAMLELLLLAAVQSCRRAGELADAITSRGGLGAVAAPDPGPKLLDAALVAGVLAILVAGMTLGTFLPGMVN